MYVCAYRYPSHYNAGLKATKLLSYNALISFHNAAITGIPFAVLSLRVFTTRSPGYNILPSPSGTEP